ncbi:MAG: LysE family transporter [Proteobacteria bacterium]|nr:LysE family transporter [Pseudomonadota bacterium]
MPLGVINVAIVDAAVDARPRFARGLGLGGGLADTVHAALAFLGVAQLVLAHPTIARALAITAAVIVGGYAIASWRRRAPTVAGPVRPPPADRLARGVATGLGLTLPNPGALGAWATIASMYPMDRTSAVVGALGVGIGSAAWFVVLAALVARVRRDHPALRILPIVAMVILVALAIVGLLRAL